MAKAISLTHTAFSKALAGGQIPLAFEPIHDLRRQAPEALLAGIGDAALEAFASREGRGRELALYLFEAAVKELRARTKTGPGSLYVPLFVREIEDQTLADSLRLIADRHSVVPEAITVIVPLEAYLAQARTVLPALLRLRLVGFGITMAIDGVKTSSFRPLAELPISGLCLRGEETWRRMRTIGPGKLGALGSWIGWAEAAGLKRLALDIATITDEATARLYGFSIVAGAHYAAGAAEQAPALRQATN